MVLWDTIKNLFANFSIKMKTGMVILILILLVIFILLPAIAINESYPFSSWTARLLVALLLVVSLSLMWLVSFYLQNKEKAWPTLTENWRRLIRALSAGHRSVWQGGQYRARNFYDRIHRNRKRRQLKKLPWYLILGTPQAGKKTLIKNTGLYFARPEHFGDEAVRYINQFPDYEWWFSEQAVLIDAMDYEEGTDQKSWRRFIKLLRRERKNKPLNGIIINFSLPDIVLYTNKKRQEFIQDVCRYVRDVYAKFRSLVPMYIIFNKCDLIEGFIEFFNDLSKEELRQVWGMTVPLENCTDPKFVRNFFHYEYDYMIDHLRQRVMWALDGERNLRGRELIHAFPQQMQLLRKPIDTFINELYGATRYPKALQLRGIYFTSGDQQYGESYDFVLQAMSKKFQLIPPKFERSARMSECYFMRNLFLEVIYPEADVLGVSERSRRMRKIAYNSALAASPVIVLLAVFGLYEGYQGNLRYINATNQHITAYQQVLSQIEPGDRNLLPVLPALRQLNNANILYEKNAGWGMHLLWTTKAMNTAIQHAMKRSLHALFLTRIAAQIEHSLNQNIQDLNLLYATLKGYLAFNEGSHTKPGAIKAPVEYVWNKAYLNQPHTANELKYYLRLSLQYAVDKLPLDEDLINRIRTRLAQVIPSQRAYGLLSLRTSISNLPALILATAAGRNFHQIFSEAKPGMKIPALYTQNGFNTIFLKQYQNIAQLVANDNKDIGLIYDKNTVQTAQQISAIMQETYHKDYIQAWDAALKNINVRPFTSLSDAIAKLGVLTGKASPLPGLLNAVDDNSANINHAQVSVVKHYQQLNAYSRDQGNLTMAETIKALNGLRVFLINLRQSANQNKAAFDAVATAIKNHNSPIQKLSNIAIRSPQPVRRWLISIANNSWDIIVASAHQYMNAAWQQYVLEAYNRGIRDRFPLNVNAHSQVAIADFNSFFGNQGTLASYFNRYLKPFVNTTTTPWTLYKIAGHSMQLPHSSLVIFARAKRVRETYFPHHANTARFNFDIKPLTLSSAASSIELIFGPKRMNYSHGPQVISSISWPLPDNNQYSSISINDFNSAQYACSANGPWSVFKIFRYGDLHQGHGNGVYLLRLNIEGYQAEYEITGPGSLSAFKLTDLHGFKLPEDIASIKPTGKVNNLIKQVRNNKKKESTDDSRR